MVICFTRKVIISSVKICYKFSNRNIFKLNIKKMLSSCTVRKAINNISMMFVEQFFDIHMLIFIKLNYYFKIYFI